MGFPILVKWHLYVESGPWLQNLGKVVGHRMALWHSWWCHETETLSALLTLCEWNPLITCGCTSQRNSNVDFWCFFVVLSNYQHYNLSIAINIYIYIYWMNFIYRGRGWCRTGPRLAGRLVEVPTHGLTAWFRYGRVGTHGWSTWPALPVFSLPCLFVLGRQGGYRRVYGLVSSGHKIIAYWGCPDILSDPVLPRFNITRPCSNQRSVL